MQAPPPQKKYFTDCFNTLYVLYVLYFSLSKHSTGLVILFVIRCQIKLFIVEFVVLLV